MNTLTALLIAKAAHPLSPKIPVPSCWNPLPLDFLRFVLIWTTDDCDCSQQFREQAGSLVQDPEENGRILLGKLFILALMDLLAPPIRNRFRQFFEYFL